MRIDGELGATAVFARQTLPEREFERLYKESYGLVYNYVCSRMSDRCAAEDVVAEAYLRAARAFHTFDPTQAKFSTWVTRIAINCMNSHYRKACPTIALEYAPETAIAVSGGQGEVANRALVDQLLGCLDATERNLVVMKYREGYRNIEIAKALDMNQSTVSTVLARALAKMRAAAESGQSEGA